MTEGQAPPGGAGAFQEISRGSLDSLGMHRQRSDRPCPELAPIGLLEGPLSGGPSSPLASERGSLGHAASPLLWPAASLDEQAEGMLDEPFGVRAVAWLRRLLVFTGPGWLMSIAYVDPGNLEADLQCGAQFGYMLLWALLGATFIGLCMQMVAARLGCASRRHLAEHCRERYPPVMRVLLWCMTELAIIGSDIQEVVGCSIGLFILFGIPLATGVVVTAATAFGFLYLERLGTRPLELFFGALIAVLAATMGGLFVKISPDQGAVLEGLLVPRMPPSAVKQVVGMVGCVIMPHNLFLHSALVQSRIVARGEEAEAVFLFTIESAAAIVTSLLINTAVVAVFAKGFFGKEDAHDIGLANAGNYLGDKYGGTLRVIWGLGLVAAGQSSTMTGAYAGQWVMQGYLQLKVKPWKRALITRGMALVPTLAVAVFFGDRHDALDELNQYLNCLQSIVLPFALVPLLTFAGSGDIMGGLRLSWVSLLLGWSAAAAIMATNVYLVVEQFSSDGSLSTALVLCLASYLGLIGVVAWVGRLSVREDDSEVSGDAGEVWIGSR